MSSSSSGSPVTISVVVPVYRGEKSLRLLLAELEPFTQLRSTPIGIGYLVSEVLLVHDCGPDRSDYTIEELAKTYSFVRPIWLTRNYGQHAATLAGMAKSQGEWVVSLDEDMQQNPGDIAAMLNIALLHKYQVVYAQPSNKPPHGALRNGASTLAKSISNVLIGEGATGQFNSFRLVQGEIARSLSSYCGNGVYLDVALRWIVSRVGYSPVKLRNEFDRPSGYTFRKLFAHFSFLMMTTGARPLRFISMLGVSSMLLAVLIAIVVLIAKLTGQVRVEGWTSLVIVITFFSGCILTALGVIAEYLALTMSIAMGKPLYCIASTPTRSAEQTS